MASMLARPRSASSILEDLEEHVDGLPAVGAAVRAYLAKLSVRKMTAVQKAAIPPALNGQDVLARGKTGTGKTLAFMIPTVEKLFKGASSSIRGLVLAHTRELATQIFAIATSLCESTAVETRLMTGGKSVSYDAQETLKGRVDLLIATPGRVQEHLETGLLDLSKCEIAVLDEADELFGNGFERCVRSILDAANPTARQTIAVSATLPESLLATLSTVMKPDRIFADAQGAGASGDKAPTASSPPRVDEAFCFFGEEDALRAVLYFVAKEQRLNPEGYKVVVFFATAKFAAFAAAALAGPLGGLYEIHAKLSDAKRKKAAEGFRTATTAVLCTSDISARGVDYPDVSLVVQCGAPTSQESYVHRLGRTGRAGKCGRGVLLLHEFEKSFVVGQGLADVSADLARALEEPNPLLATAAANVDAAVAVAARDAFLAHQTQQKKATGISKTELLARATRLATGCLGRSTDPEIDASFAKTIGLASVPGVKLAASTTTANCDEDDAAKKAERLALKAEKAAEVRAAKIAQGQKAKAEAAARRAADGN